MSPLVAQSGQSSCAHVCPLLDQSRQRRILAGDGLSAYDPNGHAPDEPAARLESEAYAWARCLLPQPGTRHLDIINLFGSERFSLRGICIMGGKIQWRRGQCVARRTSKGNML